MAFLDNSGDIILDAVLTDTGRKRMAQGTFQVAQFALGDDEIDYSLYNLNESNSAYYDLKILQTPILESFTNNMSSMKSKLITITRTDLLFLPVLKLYNLSVDSAAQPNTIINTHVIAVDQSTENTLTSQTLNLNGIIQGLTIANNTRFIRIDQGTDSSEEPNAGQSLDPELTETSYIIEIDNRLGSILSIPSNGSVALNPSYIDDDNIASYFITQGQQGNLISALPLRQPNNPNTNDTVLNGRRGTSLKFTIKSNTDLASNDFLFNRLGSTDNSLGTTLKFIDSNVRITGVSTGYRIDVPVRFVKI